MRYPGVAQFGRALEWGSRGREFDSRHSDQIKQTDFMSVCFILFEGQIQNPGLLNPRGSVVKKNSTVYCFLDRAAKTGTEGNALGRRAISAQGAWQEAVSSILATRTKNPCSSEQGFFIQADRLGISSRFSVYIIATFVRRISSHRRCVYLYRLDEIQRLCR